MKEHPLADCICHTCERWIHHLGIARHRRKHFSRGEGCKITFSTGVTKVYLGSATPHPLIKDVRGNDAKSK